jgi:polyisoprenoid-binding protein YceI
LVAALRLEIFMLTSGKVMPWITLVVSGMLLAADGAPNLSSTRSSLTATFKQSGVPVDASFKSFSGRIVYDPASVATASAALEVQTSSLDLGEEPYNAEVRKKSWLDAANYPRATFTSTGIRAAGAGRFDANGKLAIKGKVQTITVPISVKSTSEGVAFDGTFTISRRAWGIGDPSWEEVLDDAVVVRFHLVSSAR